jgi:regulator of sirC expression with transglutaminase-like and TPR domain
MECPSTSPLEYFAALVADDDSLSLTEAAGAIALADHPGLDLQAVLTELDELALRLRRRLPADAGALQRVRVLHRLLYEELGFAGNVNDYYDPANSHLHEVLHRRRGIPISLAVFYLELAGQIGLEADGVAFPGYFLVKLHLPMGEAVIDPLTGQSLSRHELEERLEPYLDHDARLGVEAAGGLGEALAEYLQPASAREILARMLRNLEAIHRASGDLLRLLQVQQRQVVLEPGNWACRRDRGETRAELGQTELAIEDLEAYIRNAGMAPDRARVAARLTALREAGPPRLH